MSPRLFFLDLRLRQDFICRACRQSALQRQPQPRWFHESSRVAARARPKDATRAKKSPLSARGTLLDQDGASFFDSPLSLEQDDPVRFFEEDSNNGKLEELEGGDAFAHSLHDLPAENWEKDITMEIGRLAESLQKESAFQGMDWASLAKEVGQKVGDTKDIRKIHAKLGAYIEDLESQLDDIDDPLSALEDDELDKLPLDPAVLQTELEARAMRNAPVPQIPEDVWTKSQRRRISQLNIIFARMTRMFRRARLPSAKSVESAWKAYSQTRQFLALSWDSVPADAWNLIWKIFATELPQDDRNRLARIALLARDMSTAKVALQPSQQLLTMEAMFVDGWEKNAIESWKRSMSTLGDGGSSTFRSYWELGVRMWCKLGNLDEATRAIDKLLSSQGDPRILMPYIKTCVELNSDDGSKKAWDAYGRLRDLLAKDMTIEDYDQVISVFLSSNQTENALHVFVDMMTAGNVSLRGKKHLPSVIANKFFFGKWLKRLIGAGDLKGAYSVLQFMRERGISASPIQVNGLIGAWQRSGGADDLQKADDIAWEMIRARIEFVRLRKQFDRLQVPVTVSEVDSPTISGPLARATLETFSLLAENYRVRQLHDRLLELWDAFSLAEISPDAFMMNQLLESYSDDGNVAKARELYQSFVHERQIMPDPYTFMALFKMLGSNRLQTLSPEQLGPETALARETFAEMVRFRSVFAASEEGMDGQLARKILHTFRRVQDNVGLILALRALRDHFGFLPSEALVLEMVVGTTNLVWDSPRVRQRLRIAGQHLQNDILQRQRAHGSKVETLGDLAPEVKGQELCDYLQRFFVPPPSLGLDDGRTLETAAREMGVFDIVQDRKS